MEPWFSFILPWKYFLFPDSLADLNVVFWPLVSHQTALRHQTTLQKMKMPHLPFIYPTIFISPEHYWTSIRSAGIDPNYSSV